MYIYLFFIFFSFLKVLKNNCCNQYKSFNFDQLEERSDMRHVMCGVMSVMIENTS